MKDTLAVGVFQRLRDLNADTSHELEIRTPGIRLR